MKCKQIVFTEKNKAEFLTVECEMGPKDVMVETMVSTISCGTERANLTGDPNVRATGASEVESHPGWFTHRDDIAAVLRLCSGGRLYLENLVEETNSRSCKAKFTILWAMRRLRRTAAALTVLHIKGRNGIMTECRV